MTLHIMSNAICMQINRDKKLMRYMTNAERENLIAKNRVRKQHILNLTDADIAVITSAFLKDGFDLKGIEWD